MRLRRGSLAFANVEGCGWLVADEIGIGMPVVMPITSRVIAPNYPVLVPSVVRCIAPALKLPLSSRLRTKD